jgi:dipeptidyl-peptidase-4
VAFKTLIDRRLGQLEVDDQIAGAKYLQSLPYVDARHIGVTGWSYGGYMTLLMLTAPDSPFAAGVAGAPVTDWTLYDTHYTERYMGTPQTTRRLRQVRGPAPPRRAEAGALLVMHGMADDNVTFDHTTRVPVRPAGRRHAVRDHGLSGPAPPRRLDAEEPPAPRHDHARVLRPQAEGA